MAQTAAIFDAIRGHVTELEEICLQDELDAKGQEKGGEEGRVQSTIRSLRREEVASPLPPQYSLFSSLYFTFCKGYIQA
jgi:hypothetical protein